ncbi:MAG: class I SAM-dependent methyltransferase [Thermoflexales bacterium]|nr:class I SAM-dependent methyltransferase [Thermoflexales bacterium]
MNVDNTTPHKSASYDQDVRQTIPFYETVHLETVDLVRRAMPGVRRWLDTGGGTGYLIELALPHFPSTQFILADPSEAMLGQAARRLANVPGHRLKILPPLGSEGMLSWDGPPPQVITALMCHHYLQAPARREALRACYQVLDDGGLFITFENIAPSTDRGLQIGLERWKHFQLEQGRALPTVEAHLKRFGVNYFPLTVAEHLELLHVVGFQRVETLWLSYMQAGFYAIK